MIAEARRLGFYSVRGNHDDTALAAYETFMASKPVPAKQSWVKEMPPGAAEWLHKLPFSIRLPSYGLVVVHAGLVPDVRAPARPFGMQGISHTMRDASGRALHGARAKWHCLPVLH